MAKNSEWTFLTNHAHVLLCIAANPDSRIRDMAIQVGITERAVQGIIADLSEGGYLTIKRDGRRNTYAISKKQKLRHSVEQHRTVQDLINLIDKAAPQKSGRSR